MLTSEEQERFFKQIYFGSVTVYHLYKPLPYKLYRSTAKKLISGIKEAKPTPDLFKELSDNIYIFSGAKTYQQIREITSFITEGKSIRPYNAFKKLAKESYDLYNDSYLATEYETAIGQAQTAVKWYEIEREKNLFPLLKREAVMDANTSDECRILNGIIAPVGDAFWKTRSPLTHFRCRCILTQISKYEGVSPSSRGEVSKAIKDTDHIDPVFKGNPGIDKVIFNKTHPYFDIAPKDKKLAKRNFDL